MCGIIGIFNNKDAWKITRSGLETIKERGRDYYGYFDGKNLIHKEKLEELPDTKSENILAHNLHAIVNLVPQPIIYKENAFAINCEIYNWQEIKKKYQFCAFNDAETLLILINKIGMDKALRSS